MRSELLIRVAQPDGAVAEDGDAWLIVGLCLIGFAATVYFLITNGWAENLGALVAQANLW
ncbi:MAG TPA: hypothetical protein VGH13_15280 [Xanthobacteraceae bacterium]|jgi:hypothetical protein